MAYQGEMVKKYVADARSLNRSALRHKRIGWFDSAAALFTEARSRLGYARMWKGRK